MLYGTTVVSYEDLYESIRPKIKKSYFCHLPYLRYRRHRQKTKATAVSTYLGMPIGRTWTPNHLDHKNEYPCYLTVTKK
jgi:hypothetical protein